MFNGPIGSITVSTVDAQGNVYAAPFGSVCGTPDGSQLLFAYLTATETPKRIDCMKKAGKMPVVVVQQKDQEKIGFEGYCVWCNIGDIEAYWDKDAGIFLQSEQNFEYEEKDVTQIVLISATNVWQEPTTTPDHSGLDPNVINGAAIAAIVIVGIIAFFIIRRKY